MPYRQLVVTTLNGARGGPAKKKVRTFSDRRQRAARPVISRAFSRLPTCIGVCSSLAVISGLVSQLLGTDPRLKTKPEEIGPYVLCGVRGVCAVFVRLYVALCVE